MYTALCCHQCRNKQAEYLLYFQKNYIHSQQIGIFDPMLICEDCKNRFRDTSRLFEHQPTFLSFKSIAKANIKRVMWLCSEKGKETNALAYPIWRKRLLHIKKYMEGVLKSYLYQMPCALP